MIGARPFSWNRTGKLGPSMEPRKHLQGPLLKIRSRMLSGSPGSAWVFYLPREAVSQVPLNMLAQRRQETSGWALTLKPRWVQARQTVSHWPWPEPEASLGKTITSSPRRRRHKEADSSAKEWLTAQRSDSDIPESTHASESASPKDK